MGNPIFEPNSEQQEQSSRDYCRHDRSSRRRLDLARNPFRIPQTLSPSDRRRAQVTRTSYRGDTFTVRGEVCNTCLLMLHSQPGCIADCFRRQRTFIACAIPVMPLRHPKYVLSTSGKPDEQMPLQLSQFLENLCPRSLALHKDPQASSIASLSMVSQSQAGVTTCVGMTSNQLWGPAEDDIPDLVSDDSEDEDALVARAPRPPRPDAEALLTLGVKFPSLGLLHAITVQGHSCQPDRTS